ncbi:MAG: outer membrane protein assembly factor BamA [Desulfobacteraceae bacterium]|nr:outer membrane protein assembly factor BamA [Desulfobacteraceae bacterium]
MSFIFLLTNNRMGACLERLLLLAAILLLALGGEAAGQEPPAQAPPGPELTGYEIKFVGNSQLGADQLREAAAYELEQFKTSGYRPADADDAAYQMELAYKNKGYAFATVGYRYEVVGGKAVVTFVIDEGPRVRIDHIAIEGNHAIGTGELRSFFRKEQQGPLGTGPVYFVKSAAEDAVSQIRDLYYLQGFMDAKVEGPEVEFSKDRERADITVKIDEGEQYRISAITFTGDLAPEVRPELKAIERSLAGQPYHRRQSLDLRSKIAEAYANNGFPEATIDVQVGQKAKPWQVVLTADIHSGPRVRISAIEISGNVKTKTPFIRSRIELKPGDFYSAKAQRRSFSALYQTGLFSKVEFSLAEGPDPHHRILKVHVEEVPTRELSVEAGWGSYELLRLRVGLEEKNLLGTGRSLQTSVGGSTKGADLTTTLIDPWFLRTGVTANLPVYFNYRIEPSFTSREVGTSLLFSKNLGKKLTLTLGYNIRNTSLTDVAIGAALEDFKNNYNLASIKSRLSYDTRNDIFFPTEGQNSYLSGEAADPVLGSQIAFFRLTTGTSRYYPLGKKSVLALRYDTGFIIPSRGQDTIPLAERFFNGGENTVRSFGQDELGPKDINGNPIGGTAYNVISAELRRQLRGPIIGTLFTDFGNVAPSREGVFGTSEAELVSATFSDYFRDMRSGVGAGLQYLLPIGPARLDAAYNPASRENEAGYKIHFSVGMAF